MKFWRLVVSMTTSRSESFLASASARHSFAIGDRVAVHPDAGPALGDRVLADDGVLGGQRAVGVAVGQVAVPQLLGELDRGLAADLLAPDHVGLLVGVGVGVAEHERRRRQDLQVVGAAAVPGEPALDVGVEGAARPPGCRAG